MSLEPSEGWSHGGGPEAEREQGRNTPFPPPTLPFPAGASPWQNPNETWRAEELRDTVPGGQPPRSQSRLESGSR